jgi:hypothetical protein
MKINDLTLETSDITKNIIQNDLMNVVSTII